MFKMKTQFYGSFETKCQEESIIPTSLLTLVAMILHGPNIELKSSKATSQPILTVSQLLMYNSLMRHPKTQATSTVMDNRELETPLPVYLGVKLHTKTRKRELVNTLYDLGHSASYDHVL